MSLQPFPFWLSHPRKSPIPDRLTALDAGDERKTMAAPGRCFLQPKQLDAGPFAADIGSFRLHLAAERKAPRTIRNYTKAVHWFAAAHLLLETSKTRWEQADRQDIERWMVYLLSRYSAAYASVQYRALQQFSSGGLRRRNFPTR